ncbi:MULTISPECIES: molybdopterin cofactor-binding domain-containing protein [Pseudomonas]|uniref:Xanthine dehydrogenase family protein molybdopterin-binding subunit n=1 Tax=Pseudomonas lutea TaxID=243924 RepID=A0ABR9A456_9PSED|nr:MULTISPECIES: molybdopterin cofactor-binding domain-containing protein [Pseudomonas]MBD8120606.1 xanthine dehydrogenase family protein molybdopterin-binding subunit [Pseudomonas lutea]
MKRRDAGIDQGRRAFLINGALVVGFAMVPGAGRAFADTEVDTLGTQVLAPDLPGSLRTNPFLDAWIRIDEQNVITVYTGKVELGTGVKTALLQVAAERLEVEPHLIVFMTADTALTPNEGYTAGSHTMFDSGTALFNAAAQVRQLLLESAARQWRTPVEQLGTQDAVIQCPDGKSMTYAQALAGVELHRYASAQSPIMAPERFTRIGQSLPRIDIPAKVSGGASYVQDMRLPGMLHARVIRPPRRGCQLEGIDQAAIENMPGHVTLVRNGSYLAVVAEDEWQAIKAMRSGYELARWSQGDPLPDAANIHQLLTQLPAKRYPIRNTVASSPGPADSSAHSWKATLTKQYLMHGSIGPSCSVAWFNEGTLTVWTHTQGVYPLRAGIAELLGLPLEKVRCVHVEGSGCYGHNGADDAAADAALIAMAVPGKPVRVQWMREQEHLWEPYSSAMRVELDVTADAAGHLGRWNTELWTTPHNERIVNAGRLLPAWLLAQPVAPAPSIPIAQPEGDGDRNVIPLYDVANSRINMTFVTQMPFRTSAMRSLGAHVNVFGIESAMDELAAQAGIDPVEFRLRNISDPRARSVIEQVAKAFGWPARAGGPGSGIGFAFARYKNIMGYCAIAVQVHVQRQTGEVVIDRVVTAVDVGQVVSPDGLRNQVEGGIIQSASWTLYEQVDYDPAGVRSYDWSGYPILRFPALPLDVEVHVLDQPGQPFLGAAEIVQGPMAAALGNALSNATGKRLLSLPLARSGWHRSL